MTEFSQGRFKVEKSLGRGAQGEVYLARDTRLERLVAIKLLKPDFASDHANEARMVSQLTHPNIVTLYDVFVENGRTGLVFEYVEGETLAARLKRDGAMSPVHAVEVMLGVLDGLSYAHEKGVIHRDIKPQNVMVDAANRPRIMDFGVARRRGAASDMSGTVGYMAPELLKNMPVDAQADVFAAGMMLYQMLTGRLAVEGSSGYVTLYRMANEDFRSPSAVRPGIDERLDHLVMVALFKDPQERYSDAGAMREALAQWLESGKTAEGDSGRSRHSTLEFLLRRMSHSADFPALSQVISAINQINNADSERLQTLSEVILRDFSLTNKLLRIVNSATYGQFGGSITTVSHAIVILGFDTIRNLAITLLLFEHMHNKTQANRLREATLKSFFGGLLSAKLGKKAGWRDTEELLICGMFQHMGKLLTLYYFNEESLEIDKRMAHEDESEERATIAVLGLSYRDLAIGVTEYWNFPDRTVNSMRAMPDGVARTPQTQSERLRFMSNLSFELLPVLEKTPTLAEKHLAEIVRRMGAAIGWNGKDLRDSIQEASSGYLQYLSLLGVEKRGSDFCRKLQKMSAQPGAAQDAVQEEDAVLGEEVVADVPLDADPHTGSTAVLSSGVQEITNALVGSYKLNDLLRMTLETMYRGIGFDRVLFCTRDVRHPRMIARFGFGSDIANVQRGFDFPLSGLSDVFLVALGKNADIFIEDIDADSIKARVPQWYRTLLPAKTFIVFPVVLEGRAIGLFYGDRDEAHSLKITPEQTNLLKTLRNQALLAIRQKQMGN